jgi:hypothetical protein
MTCGVWAQSCWSSYQDSQYGCLSNAEQKAQMEGPSMVMVSLGRQAEETKKS